MAADTLVDTVPDADAHLIVQSLQGEAVAFQNLYHRHERRVRSALRNLCGDEGLDDLVQEVFIKVWRNLGSFRGDAAFSTWIFRIVHNVAMDCRRAYAVRRSGMQAVETAQGNEASLSSQTSEEQEIVKTLLGALDFEQRRVLVLVDLEGFSLQEVADIIGIPLGTVKSRLHYARATARKFLEGQGVKI